MCLFVRYCFVKWAFHFCNKYLKLFHFIYRVWRRTRKRKLSNRVATVLVAAATSDWFISMRFYWQLVIFGRISFLIACVLMCVRVCATRLCALFVSLTDKCNRCSMQNETHWNNMIGCNPLFVYKNFVCDLILVDFFVWSLYYGFWYVVKIAFISVFRINWTFFSDSCIRLQYCYAIFNICFGSHRVFCLCCFILKKNRIDVYSNRSTENKQEKSKINPKKNWK